MIMEKLELKHLAPYLPYGLKVYNKRLAEQSEMVLTVYTNGYTGMKHILTSNYYKPILRPLSDLFIKRFDDENGGLSHIYYISKNIFFDNHIDDESTYEQFWHKLINSMIYPTLNQSKELLDFLYKNHYDVESLFNNGKGLIEKGLAIDKNTIK